MNATNQWDGASMRLGSQGFKGTLYLIQADEVRPFFQLDAGDNDQFTITPNSTELDRFGMTETVIEPWMQAAQ